MAYRRGQSTVDAFEEDSAIDTFEEDNFIVPGRVIAEP